MRFEGVYYINLARRTQRDWVLNYILDCQGFPSDKIFRIEGVDAMEYESKEDIILAYIQTYPELECLMEANGKKGNIACIISWKNILTRIYNDLSDVGMALCLLDDVFVAKRYREFHDLIDRFDKNIDVVQLFYYTQIKEQVLPRKDSAYDNLFVGGSSPGDTALLLSKEGAKNILDVYRQFSHTFPEWLLFEFADKINNFYSIKDSWLWIRLPNPKYQYSDRDAANTN